MGQIVQYGNMQAKNRDKTLQWNDQKAVEADKGPLAAIVPLKDTINFEKKVVNHHKKVQKDVTSCLKGTKLNKFQKQRESSKNTVNVDNNSSNGRKQSAKAKESLNKKSEE